MPEFKAKHIQQPKNGDSYTAFFRCPKGHHLPHRVKGKGRCAPFDCCLAKDGAHGVVRQSEKAQQAEALSYAEETMELKDRAERMRAWNDAHPLPELPKPPKLTSVREYMEKRIEQSMPLALERRIRVATLDPGHAGELAARELLNRGGFGERPEIRQQFNGPVLLVNVTAEQMKSQSPYASQGKPQPEVAHVVDGEIVAQLDASNARGDDAPSAPRSVETGSSAEHAPARRRDVEG